MRSLEDQILEKARKLLEESVKNLQFPLETMEIQFRILESVASLHAGWSIEEYWYRFRDQGRSLAEFEDLQKPASAILAALQETEIPVPLALASLAREDLAAHQQRTTGAYYTDWRLAQLVAKRAIQMVSRDGLWLDPACGTGILLIAAALTVDAGQARDEIIAQKLAGADLSEAALQGVLLSIAATTANLEAVEQFSTRLRSMDSLLSPDAWTAVSTSGVALVIGNPPWEKMKVSRHELALKSGAVRKYGERFHNSFDLTDEKQLLAKYISQVKQQTELQGKGESDLYKLFLELGIKLTSSGGVLAMLLPAGLIRSAGTRQLRDHLDAVSSQVEVFVMENRNRHFAIDTRFKFISLFASIDTGKKKPLVLRVADRRGTLPHECVQIDRADLTRAFPDRSLPEVRTQEEWRLLNYLLAESTRIGDSAGPWNPSFLREVDMTTDLSRFVEYPTLNSVPLLEGRHVGQFRWRAKSYKGGEGRSSRWAPILLGEAANHAVVHWHVRIDGLRENVRQRLSKTRIGFRDITGQTNERTFLAARIPAGVACGNKVPTLLFEDGGKCRENLFLAFANSFVVDWVVRRMITTTLNRFILDQIPFPNITEDDKLGSKLSSLAECVINAEGDPDVDSLQVGHWRAEIDATVAFAWEISVEEMETILADFPLLDRGQPVIGEEKFSTVSKDLVLSKLAELWGKEHPSQHRATNAIKLGAVPYIGAEYAKGI